MKISWVTLERWAREKAGPPGAGRNRPYRDDAERLSDGQLLEKLRGLGIELDRTGLEALCQGANSAQEVASQLTDRHLTEAQTHARIGLGLARRARPVAAVVACQAVPGNPR